MHDYTFSCMTRCYFVLKICGLTDFEYVCIIILKQPDVPGSKIIHQQHIRRLSKAYAGALYPVLSDPSGQSFLDISTAVCG